MRLRGNNNAASVACAVVAFVLVGCAIAVGGILADFEAAVLKFGIVAYLFLAGPLFFALLSGGMTSSNQKSFRLTPPAYMEGKRVRPRLLLFGYARSLSGLAVLVLAYFGQIWAMCRFGVQPASPPWQVVVFMTIPWAAAYVTWIAFTSFSVKLGWLTPEEARTIHFRRWPESWLEPADEQDGPAQPEGK